MQRRLIILPTFRDNPWGPIFMGQGTDRSSRIFGDKLPIYAT